MGKKQTSTAEQQRTLSFHQIPWKFVITGSYLFQNFPTGTGENFETRIVILRTRNDDRCYSLKFRQFSGFSFVFTGFMRWYAMTRTIMKSLGGGMNHLHRKCVISIVLLVINIGYWLVPRNYFEVQTPTGFLRILCVLWARSWSERAIVVLRLYVPWFWEPCLRVFVGEST